jgi:hypothetical protein
MESGFLDSMAYTTSPPAFPPPVIGMALQNPTSPSAFPPPIIGMASQQPTSYRLPPNFYNHNRRKPGLRAVTDTLQNTVSAQLWRYRCLNIIITTPSAVGCRHTVQEFAEWISICYFAFAHGNPHQNLPLLRPRKRKCCARATPGPDAVDQSVSTMEGDCCGHARSMVQAAIRRRVG